MKITSVLIALLVLLCSTAVAASQVAIKPFRPGSYQQILTAHADRPFMLVVWSITCSSCLQEMKLLDEIHKNRPGVKIVMLAADEIAANAEIRRILEANHLADTENWVFDEEDAQKLRFEIDPAWYGELPRTYFFNHAHQRTAVSGVLSPQEYETRLADMFK